MTHFAFKYYCPVTVCPNLVENPLVLPDFELENERGAPEAMPKFLALMRLRNFFQDFQKKKLIFNFDKSGSKFCFQMTHFAFKYYYSCTVCPNLVKIPLFLPILNWKIKGSRRRLCRNFFSL